jgi:hypothetical protein
MTAVGLELTKLQGEPAPVSRHGLVKIVVSTRPSCEVEYLSVLASSALAL